MKKSQAELIKSLPHDILRKQLLLSQGLLLIIGVILSIFLFDSLSKWQGLFYWNLGVILLYGLLPAVLLALFEMILSYLLPKDIFDDGGINEKIFKEAPVPWIFMICVIVAISEEILFRGVIQTSFGYIFASSLFVLIHFRYLKKFILFIFIVLTSFLIGYLYELTQSMYVVITFHFVLDLSLGLFIRIKK